MNANSTARFLGALLDLIDDLVSEFRSKMIATQLIRTAATAAAKYRAAQQTGCRARISSKMCLVLEEADHSTAWLERVERQRIARRLFAKPSLSQTKLSRKLFPRAETSAVFRPMPHCRVLPRNHRGLERRDA
jgi:hypothetical protein